jgi:formate hydrogenlyase transcriptional activator
MPHRDFSRLLAAVGEAADPDNLIRLILDLSPVGTMVVDDQGVILYANREAERDFGSPAEELAGKSVDTLVPAGRRSDHAALRAAYLKSPETRQMGTGRYLLGRRTDGTEFPIEVGLTPIEVGSRTLILASVVNVTAQRRAEDASRRNLDERLAFEAVVSEISADFINLPSEGLDGVINGALGKIVEVLDLDRAVVWLRDDDGDDFHLAHGWERPGMPAITEPLSPEDLFSSAWVSLLAGGVFSFSTVRDIPDESTRLNAISFGAKAGITVSFSIAGRIAGLVYFLTAREEREWPAEIVHRLQLVARVFANAITRQRADKALHDALAEVRRLGDRLNEENTYLRSEVRHAIGASTVVGQSPAIQKALELVAQVAPTDSTVLLLGETGAGKELFATQVHDLSARRGRVMVRVNCAAIPDTLLESELFGREKGAYTGALTRQTGRFELADKSTIFLDEIGDLPLDVQVKLLRVLEDRQIERLGSSRPIKVDVRIVVATHRNLEEMVAAGTFREDLYYRLNVFPIRVPPLRERPDDIALLVWRFVDEFSKRFGKPIASIDKDSLTDLQRYSWPGNVRELHNLVERAMIVATPNGRLAIPLVATTSAAATTPRSSSLMDVEAAHMRSILESCGWRVRGAGGAAERLGLKPSTLETRMAKHGIKRSDRSA